MYTKSSYTKLTEDRIDKNEKKNKNMIKGRSKYLKGYANTP